MSQKLHEAKVQRLRFLWVSYPELPAPIIAVRIGCSERTVWNYVKAMDLHRPPCDEDDDDIGLC